MLAIVIVGSGSLPAQDIPSPCVEPDCVLLDVPYHCQEHEGWCWAACGEMIMDFFQVFVRQCDQVNQRTTQDCCPAFPEEDLACNFPDWPHFKSYGFRVTKSRRPLAWVHLQNQLAVARRPFAWAYAARGSRVVGHMLVVCGYFSLQGVPMVVYQNPNPWCGDPERDPNAYPLSAYAYDQYANGPIAGYYHRLDIFPVPKTTPEDAAPHPVALGAPNPDSTAAPQPDWGRTPEAAVANILTAFAALGTNTNPVRYGFLTPAEITLARPGIPASIQVLPFADLLTAKRGATLESLLQPTGQFIIPVAVNRQTRCAVTLQRQGPNWQVAGLGDAAVARTLVATRARSSARSVLSPRAYFIVRLPFGLNTFVLAHRANPGLILTPLYDDAPVGFRAGVDISAAVALPALIRQAQRTPGFPEEEP
ncbi:MAG: papain-like cysteine protease family protein [Verrucomicrobiota bacterium]